MTIKLYNSRTKKIEDFQSVEDGLVKMYTCGPTVYDFIHIGNLRSFTFADFLKKMFQVSGYKTLHVMNITDFGHLKGDGDDGEDKMMVGLKREGLETNLNGMKKLADIYTEYFKQDIIKMNLEIPSFLPRAIEYIPEYLDLIKRLDEKGFVYKTSDGLYFDTSKDPHYGEMMNTQNRKEEESRIGENSEKKNFKDFALFKFNNELGFESPFGKGFPGWHIECSGMSEKFLGKTFDIHTGGIDNMIHHVNEIAQSENANGCLYSKFFMHAEHLNINNQKMAKSDGGFITLKTLEEKGYSALEYRYFLLQGHYRKNVNFSWEAMDASKTALEKLKTFLEKVKQTGDKKINQKYWEKFLNDLQFDLHTPKALATLWTLVKDKEVSDEEKYCTILEMDKVFSLGLK